MLLLRALFQNIKVGYCFWWSYQSQKNKKKALISFLSKFRQFTLFVNANQLCQNLNIVPEIPRRFSSPKGWVLMYGKPWFCFSYKVTSMSVFHMRLFPLRIKRSVPHKQFWICLGIREVGEGSWKGSWKGTGGFWAVIFSWNGGESVVSKRVKREGL